MSLDAQTQAFLELGRAQGGPSFAEMTVTEARTVLKETMQACAIPAHDVESVRTISIESEEGPLELRVYHPPDRAQAKWPILLLFHGGAWALSDLDEYDSLARFLCANSSSIVIAVDYRLAPEHKFPAGLNDCYTALCWVANNAQQLHGDVEQIAVIGDSSGGNLAAAVCHMTRDQNGPAISRQILLYPLLALQQDPPFQSRKLLGNGDYFISKESIQWSVDLYLTDDSEANDPRASPIRLRDFSGLPTALIITAGYDPLCDEGAAYYASLVNAQVDAQYKCFESTIHGFLSFAGVLDIGREGLKFVCDWLCDSFNHDQERPGGHK